SPRRRRAPPATRRSPAAAPTSRSRGRSPPSGAPPAARSRQGAAGARAALRFHIKPPGRLVAEPPPEYHGRLMSAPALVGVGRPTLRFRGTSYPVLLPTVRDPRLHL